MTVLQISSLGLSFQGTFLFRDVTAALRASSRVGLVGPNGAGKTSLLRVLLDQIPPDKGTFSWVGRHRFGYVPQSFGVGAGETPLSLFGASSGKMDRSAAGILGRSGIGKALWETPVSQLSGGERTRLSLALAFSGQPDVLILDEPTNHLDIAGIEWLERRLQGFNGSALIVSHDRYFLDNTTDQIWEMDLGLLKVYPGNYSAYRKQKETETATVQRGHDKWAQEVRELQVEVRNRREWYRRAHDDAGKNDFYRRKAKKHARAFLAKEKTLTKLVESEPDKVLSATQAFVGLSGAKQRTRTIARAEDLCFGYPEADGRGPDLLRGLSFEIRPGRKVGLIGRNGSGKSTLLRLIAGELAPRSGGLWVNPGVKVRYLAQMHDALDPKLSPVQNLCAETGLGVKEARDLLARMEITDETQLRPTGTLSMGEQTRVAISCLTHGPCDCLLLDEPTNHLDLSSQNAVEQALCRFSGAVVVACHDRYLMDAVCDSIWRLDKGAMETHRGNYTSMVEADCARRRLEAGHDPAREARLLALRTNIADVVFKISAAKIPAEKERLEDTYQVLLAEFRELHRK